MNDIFIVGHSLAIGAAFGSLITYGKFDEPMSGTIFFLVIAMFANILFLIYRLTDRR